MKMFTHVKKSKKPQSIKTGVMFTCGPPEAIRTSDSLLRRKVLYPAELRAVLFFKEFYNVLINFFFRIFV